MRHIPSRWSFNVKYVGGHRDIMEECNAILRFTRKRVEIESLRKGKIILDYKDCLLERQVHLENRRIVIIYGESLESEGRIFLQVRKKDENIMNIFDVYKNAALGLNDQIPMDYKKYFKF